MLVTKERVLAERVALKQIRDQLDQQAQQAMMRLARAEGGLHALDAILAMLDAPEMEVQDGNKSGENAGMDREKS